jgi:uncharacterized protein
VAAEPLSIELDAKTRVSGLMLRPPRAIACFVFAHGAGAGMAHPFMAAAAEGLAEHRIATLRFQFPYMERNSKRPDSPALCHATVRAAVDAAHRLAPMLPLIAGGKSFGGRMCSQAQAADPLAHVCGLMFMGFPLHPPKAPSEERAAHLSDIRIPLLFLQGTRDALAELALLREVVTGLGERATLSLSEDADHSFHVPARTGRTDSDIMSAMLRAAAQWVASILG